MTHPAPVDLPTSKLFRLEERTIVITGGAGAVGSSVAKAILESGGDVVLLDMAASAKPDIWKMIQDAAEANSTQASYFQVNVTDADSIAPLFDKIRPTLRHPTRGLVAAAGISGEANATDYPIDIFRKIIDVNVAGTFLITQAVAREMHRSNVPGSVVLIASMSGWIANRGINTAAYNASKSAVHQLARSLAAEWGHPNNTFPGNTIDGTSIPKSEEGVSYPPIRVNTLSPGHIETPLSESARVRGLTDKWADQNMLGRISQVDEFRAPVLFLLGDGSSYMTGADLRVDGGHCAW
ncbi:hypothetical protein BDV96DRAFT_578237 [Lophiotrema nucula]|uniref:NAD(P)-binding protein n=1 Tax=Lophiotrema nucula TaxID=690887 RepID=A0A6A5Z3P7_9PLEO|nr:hypothetical protein BDV96DRAFT_578237 [Lophiotrema nucula]